MIFNWYADGIGTRVIANKLKELGYKTNKGNDFRYNQVGNIIKNEKLKIFIIIYDIILIDSKR